MADHPKRWVRTEWEEDDGEGGTIQLHVTDGGYTDEDPAPVVRALQDRSTDAGSVLVFNCHLSESEGQAVSYPSAAEAEGFSKRARFLYEMSSQLPEPMRQEALTLGYEVEMGAHGYVLNADLTSLVDFLDIGTKPVWSGVMEP